MDPLAFGHVISGGRKKAKRGPNEVIFLPGDSHSRKTGGNLWKPTCPKNQPGSQVTGDTLEIQKKAAKNRVVHPYIYIYKRVPAGS